MTYAVKVHVNADEIRALTAQAGERLLDVLAKAGIAVSAPCGGNGKCGKCRVKASGGVKTDENGECLACRTLIEGDCDVYISDKHSTVLTDGIKTEADTDGETGLGLAVDIGTTTVAAYLAELKSGKVLANASMLNPQRTHGADVISRLEYACESADNAKLLKHEIDDMLNKLAGDMLERTGRKDASITRAALVGNTTMMHLAGGYPVAGIAKAPFQPYYTAAHMRNNAGMNTFCGGCISGYVGADTLAAMLACEFDKHSETALLIDIGTNGEIVLRHNGRYLCCSCAAGPAFEGAHIECGTGAIEGAIDHVKPKANGGFEVSTIGGKPAVGICGSGLVDAVAYLVDEEEVSPAGRLGGKFELSNGIYISPADIREVQLAKAAIAAGIRILADRAGIELEDIEKVYLAGGFGNFIEIESACKIGLLPMELKDKILPVGNAAGTGAQMLVMSKAVRARMEQLRNESEYIELSIQDDFEDLFAECLLFGEDE